MVVKESPNVSNDGVWHREKLWRIDTDQASGTKLRYCGVAWGSLG